MTTIRNKPFAELLGLPEIPKTGRERLVAIAVELFYRNGFTAVGIDRSGRLVVDVNGTQRTVESGEVRYER